jgi:hypothetical protein
MMHYLVVLLTGYGGTDFFTAFVLGAPAIKSQQVLMAY